jgi:hypothetical protein
MIMEFNYATVEMSVDEDHEIKVDLTIKNYTNHDMASKRIYINKDLKFRKEKTRYN